jgi:hypothetical protein
VNKLHRFFDSPDTCEWHTFVSRGKNLKVVSCGIWKIFDDKLWLHRVRWFHNKQIWKWQTNFTRFNFFFGVNSITHFLAQSKLQFRNLSGETFFGKLGDKNFDISHDERQVDFLKKKYFDDEDNFKASKGGWGKLLKSFLIINCIRSSFIRDLLFKMERKDWKQITYCPFGFCPSDTNMYRYGMLRGWYWVSSRLNKKWYDCAISI